MDIETQKQRLFIAEYESVFNAPMSAIINTNILNKSGLDLSRESQVRISAKMLEKLVKNQNLKLGKEQIENLYEIYNNGIDLDPEIASEVLSKSSDFDIFKTFTTDEPGELLEIASDLIKELTASNNEA